jgi:hypothetical protein
MGKHMDNDNLFPRHDPLVSRRGISPKSSVEQVTLSQGISEILTFLSRPDVFLASPQFIENQGLRAQLEAIQKEHPSVYNTEVGSEGDTQERRDLKAALDKVGEAAKALSMVAGNNRPIAKGELRRTHIAALKEALEKIDECKKAFQQSGAHDGQATSGHIFAKMFDGNTLEAAVINQAQTIIGTLETAAEKTDDKRSSRS